MAKPHKIIATFRPQRIGDLRNGAEDHIGWRGEWRYKYTMGDGVGLYTGQPIYESLGESAPPWAALNELEGVVWEGTLAYDLQRSFLPMRELALETLDSLHRGLARVADLMSRRKE